MYKYTLPNGIVINSDRLAEAALNKGEFPQLYLDTETGMLIEVPSMESLGKWVNEIGNSKRHYLLEPFNSEDRKAYAHDFVEELMVMEFKGKKI
ncbi:MAG TPA: hypothetical protein PKA42_01510 [Candidatus Paceibacterota bacterium]|nr:hypothetical protein [Candidatus Paceibacterota bacterium]HMO82821.1 hypothetical protein [Candidatus Paceibacterota bacterium]